MISNLQTGSDNLTLADMNEEGANMLALQTRQQLGIQALSLASQANQSVMRLFGYPRADSTRSNRGGFNARPFFCR